MGGTPPTHTHHTHPTHTQDQYFFIHEAIAEALLCGNTEVSLEGLGAYISELGAAVPNDDSTHIEVQFKVCQLSATVNKGFKCILHTEVGH